ncbi:MAG: spermidine synthase [Phycisphaerae bacterium]
MTRRKLLLIGLLSLHPLAAVTQSGERVLYEKKSPYNLVVVTEDDRGLRSLLFERGGARQSVVKVGDPDHIELPYAKVMLVGLGLAKPPKRVLVVGLGGGTIPGILHKHYPKTMIDVVDIDPDVVKVAKEFFGFQEDATMRVHVADGRRFIEQCEEPYDMIFLDAYGDEEIPYHLATQQFLQAVRGALNPNGIVIANLWSRGLNPLYDSMIRTYQHVFASVYLLDVRGTGNRIVIALPQEQRIERRTLARKARAVSRNKRLRFDLGDLVMQGFQQEPEVESDAAVLKDKVPTTTAASRPVG